MRNFIFILRFFIKNNIYFIFYKVIAGVVRLLSKKSFSADSLNYIRGKSHGKNKEYTRSRR